MAQVLGIDFGLMNIVSAAAGGGGPVITTPTVVYFDSEHGPITGDAGLDAAANDPERAVLGMRQGLGDEQWNVTFDGTTYRAADLAPLVFAQVAKDIHNTIGAVAGAVVTVPAYFHDGQRRAVLDAVASCGLPLLQIMNAPSAAALAYATVASVRGLTMVYSLGDGNLDVTILDVQSPDEIMVYAAAGDCGAFDEPIAAQVERSEAIVLSAIKDAGTKPDALAAILPVGHSARFPEVASMLQRLCGGPPQDEIDPIEVVAHGAALQAEKLRVAQSRAA